MYVSILGDSISTWQGFNPAGYSVFYDERNACIHGLSTVYDTWWAQVNQYLRAWLCVNNAYSGSRVSGQGFPAACSPERLRGLHTAQNNPDVILVYMGFNDFGCGVPVWGADSTCFVQAYDRMLYGLRKNYPQARILCGTLMRGYIKNRPDWEFPESFGGVPFAEYNRAIRTACSRNRCALVDLEARGILYETLDGTHPTAAGHTTIARCWISCLRKDGAII